MERKAGLLTRRVGPELHPALPTLSPVAMYYTQSCMGVRKHRQAGNGKKSRLRSGSHLAAPVLNRAADETRRLHERRRPTMYGSVRELMQAR